MYKVHRIKGDHLTEWGDFIDCFDALEFVENKLKAQFQWKYRDGVFTLDCGSTVWKVVPDKY